jgi:hypothetical protein
LVYDGQDISTDLKHVDYLHRIRAVTNDDRVAEVVEECATAGIGSFKVPFDCIIVPLINGSPDYIEWIKLQTMKKDDQLAFYNVDPEAMMHGLDNAIDDMSSVADVSHAESTILPSGSQAVQIKSESTFADGDDDEDSTADREATGVDYDKEE